MQLKALYTKIFRKEDNSSGTWEAELHPLMLLDDLKLIYFPIPKVAASSFKYVFATHLNYDQSLDIKDHNKLHKIIFPSVDRSEVRSADYDDYLKFTCVRNPWDRLVSCYKSKIKSNKRYKNIHFKNGVDRRFLYYKVFKAGMSFNTFVHEVCNIPDIESDFHFRSQYDFVYHNHHILINHLMKYETLGQEYKKLNSKLGNKLAKLPKMNSTKRHKPTSAYFDKELINLVRKRYDKDFQYFKYSDRP